MPGRSCINTWAQCVECQFWRIFLFLCTTRDFTIYVFHQFLNCLVYNEYFMDVLWSCRLDIWKYLLPKDFQPIVRGNYRSLSRICSCLIRIEASRTLKNAPKPQLMGLKPLRSRTWISKHQQFHDFFFYGGRIEFSKYLSLLFVYERNMHVSVTSVVEFWGQGSTENRILLKKQFKTHIFLIWLLLTFKKVVKNRASFY